MSLTELQEAARSGNIQQLGAQCEEKERRLLSLQREHLQNSEELYRLATAEQQLKELLIEEKQRELRLDDMLQRAKKAKEQIQKNTALFNNDRDKISLNSFNDTELIFTISNGQSSAHVKYNLSTDGVTEVRENDARGKIIFNSQSDSISLKNLQRLWRDAQPYQSIFFMELCNNLSAE